MLTLADIRKQPDGIVFEESLDLNDNLIKRNPEILSVNDVVAKGVVTYDDGLYVLHYQLDYKITLPSTRSMLPVELTEQLLVDEIFVEANQSEAKKELIEENLALILESDHIDLEESASDNILLSIPLQVLGEDELMDDEMPSGHDWVVMTEEQYQHQQAEKKQKSNPFAALDGLFDDE